MEWIWQYFKEEKDNGLVRIPWHCYSPFLRLPIVNCVLFSLFSVSLSSQPFRFRPPPWGTGAAGKERYTFHIVWASNSATAAAAFTANINVWLLPVTVDHQILLPNPTRPRDFSRWPFYKSMLGWKKSYALPGHHDIFEEIVFSTAPFVSSKKQLIFWPLLQTATDSLSIHVIWRLYCRVSKSGSGADFCPKKVTFRGKMRKTKKCRRWNREQKTGKLKNVN